MPETSLQEKIKVDYMARSILLRRNARHATVRRISLKSCFGQFSCVIKYEQGTFMLSWLQIVR